MRRFGQSMVLFAAAACSSGGTNAQPDAGSAARSDATTGGGMNAAGGPTGNDGDASAEGSAPGDDAPAGNADAGTDAGTDESAPAPAITTGDGGDPSRGMQAISVDGNGVWVYLPQSMTATDRAPVIFSLQGLDIPAFVMADITQLPALAESQRFVAIFPEGSGGTWNTGGATCGLGSFAGNSNDDAKYMDDILTAVSKMQALDRSRVFMSGFSMGAYGTSNLACSRPDLARAAAAASGGRTTKPCSPAPQPIILFHGTNDGTIAYSCGVDSRTAWALHNGCSTDVDTVMVMGGQCDYSRGCPKNGQVVLCSFNGMGHGWAGSNDPFALGGSQYDSATALMWAFFKMYL